MTTTSKQDGPGKLLKYGHCLGSLLRYAVGALVVLVLAHSALAQQYTYTTIDFPGATSTVPGGFLGTEATGVNDSNQVVGFYGDSSGTFHGYLWSAGQFTGIDYPGSTGTVATGINNAGQIVGYYFGGGAPGCHGFLLSGGTFSSFDFNLPSGLQCTVPVGINDSGQIVGTYQYSPSPGRHVGGFLLAGAGFQAINYPGLPETNLISISWSGEIFGLGSTLPGGSGIQQPFSYSQGSFTPLSSLVFGINASGDLALPSGIRKGTQFVPINYPSANSTEVAAINDLDAVVGIYFDNANLNATHAFIAVPTASAGCFSPAAHSYAAAGGLGSFFVTSANCGTTTPAATTPDSWITLLPGPYVCAPPTPSSSCPSPPASGSVQFAIAKNPTSGARTGQILVSGQAFTVVQAGVSSICSFSVTPLSQVAPAAGGPLTPVRVVASSSSCKWGASVNAGSALQVTSGQSGAGNGIVSLSVSPNSGATRTLTATIAGQTVSVQQNGSSLVCGAVDVSSSVTINQVSFTSGWPGLYFGIGSDAETISVKNNTGSTLQNLFLVLHNIPVYPIPATSPEYSLVIPASQNTSCFRTPLPEQMISLGSIGSQQKITVDMTFNFINDYYGHGMNSWTLLSGLPNK